MNLSDLLKAIKSNTDDELKGRTIKRKVLLPEELQEQYKVLDKLAKEERSIAQKRKILRDKFWANVHEFADDYDDMQYDEATGEVWIYEDKD